MTTATIILKNGYTIIRHDIHTEPECWLVSPTGQTLKRLTLGQLQTITANVGVKEVKREFYR